MHGESDIDLLILIGYDTYCTTWEMPEWDASLSHAHLSKLLDAPLVYIRDESVKERPEALCEKARVDLRFEKSAAAFERAKMMYADVCLCDFFGKMRANAGAAISFLSRWKT